MSDQTDLSGYTVAFKQNAMGAWEYEITTPDDDLLFPFGAFIKKQNAKIDAMKAIERHKRNETLDGNQLRDSL